MKIHKTILAISLALASFSGAIASESENHKNFLVEKKFDKLSFNGCVMTIDSSTKFIYTHIGNTSLFTTMGQVRIFSQGESFSTNLNNKDEFVKEYIFRQNYCSFIR